MEQPSDGPTPPQPDMNEPYLAICPPAPILFPPPKETATDGTVTIRRWREADADVLFRIITASRVRLAEWMPWARNPTFEPEEAAAFTQRAQTGWEDGTRWGYAITITEGEGGKEVIVGSCGLRPLKDQPGVNVGYWLAEGHTGKGYATRAAKMLTEAAFEMNAASVRILHDSANLKSRAVPERLGFECQGDVEADENPGGRPDTAWVKYPTYGPQ